MLLQDVVEEMCTVQQSECLIEGTIKDKISHFVLRLACCQSAETELFFLTAETLLFDWRFSCMSEPELCKLLKSMDPYLNLGQSQDQNRETILDIFCVFTSIKRSCGKWRNVVMHYLNGENSKWFYVKFQNVLQLVQRREVCLTKGIAAVPFCHLRTVVTVLFGRMLRFGLDEMRTWVQTEDGRLIELIRTVKAIFRQRYRQKSIPSPWNIPPITNRDVDRLAEYFPLCMSHALRSLRRKHRLGHHTRLQLTLFLKELGLPIHEALIFWKDEYSKPSCNHGNRGSQDWIPNEGRYTYNIRHLYGLEGSRVNYKGHSCKYLQDDFQGHKEEGGCPFSNFDLENLTKVMVREGFRGNYENVVQHAANGNNYSLACQEYMNENIKKPMKDRNCTSSKDQKTENNQGIREFCTTCDQKAPSMLISAPTEFGNPGSSHMIDEGLKSGDFQYSSVADQSEVSSSKQFESDKSKHACNSCEMGLPIQAYESNDLTNVDNKHALNLIPFTKPIDYYLSYKALIDKLNNVK